MTRQWTKEEIKRLVPEARRIECPDKPAGHVFEMYDNSGCYWAENHGSPFWLALLQTRLDLETANKDLKALRTENNDLRTQRNARDKQFIQLAREQKQGVVFIQPEAYSTKRIDS